MHAQHERIITEKVPDGRELVARGRALGNRVAVGKTAFLQERGVLSEADDKRNKAQTGAISWSMIMGLGSLEAQIEGLKYLHAFGRRTGVKIDRGLVIPSVLTGLPPEMRQKAPQGTSFLLQKKEDWQRIAQAAPIQPCFNDFHIGSPNAVENTLHAVGAGCSYHGVLSQFVWDLPYWEGDAALVAETVKAIGIIAAKRDDHLMVDSYLDDGIASHFMDYASLVGYACLEKYVVETLCGARYATGFGGLMSHIPTKIGVWLALNDLLESDLPCLSYLYGDTIGKTGDEDLLMTNYGSVAAETIAFVAVEKRYRTGVSILPNPITEKIQVPTVEDIAQVHAVARAAEKKAAEIENLLDYREIERIRALLVQKGRAFFHNVLEGLKTFAVDVKDPLQVLLAVRRLGPQRLETLFHPGEGGGADRSTIVPFFPSELAQQSMREKRSQVKAIKEVCPASTLRGKKMVVCSADAHSFGLYVLRGVLEDLGVTVVDGGVDMNAEEVLALAARESCRHVSISIHNGQCLDYAQKIVQGMRARQQDVTVYMGGRLNAVHKGEAAPRDASDDLRALGIVACATVKDMVVHLCRRRR